MSAHSFKKSTWNIVDLGQHDVMYSMTPTNLITTFLEEELLFAVVVIIVIKKNEEGKGGRIDEKRNKQQHQQQPTTTNNLPTTLNVFQKQVLSQINDIHNSQII